LKKVHELDPESADHAQQLEFMQKIITSSLFVNINTSRNSA